MKGVVKRASSIFAGVMRILANFMEAPSAVKALATWQKFSVTSYFMVYRLLKQDILPRTVVDVGANVGQFAIASSKLFPEARVHSFEPVPECAEELRKNVARLGNVMVYPCALGQKEGTLSFHVNVHSHSSSLFPLAEAHRAAFPKAQEDRTIEVEVSTLDRVFEGIELEPPVLIKLDVQGYEAHVLRGGEKTLKRADYVVMEVSFRPMYEGEKPFREMLRMMEDYDFRFERPVGWLWEPRTGEILQTDALFVRNDN